MGLEQGRALNSGLKVASATLPSPLRGRWRVAPDGGGAGEGENAFHEPMRLYPFDPHPTLRFAAGHPPRKREGNAIACTVNLSSLP